MDEQRLIEEIAEAVTASRGPLNNPTAYRDRVRVTVESRFHEYGATWLQNEAKKYGLAPASVASPARSLPVECGLCGMHISPAALRNPETTPDEHGYPVSVGCAFRKSADACSLARSIVTQIREEQNA